MKQLKYAEFVTRIPITDVKVKKRNYPEGNFYIVHVRRGDRWFFKWTSELVPSNPFLTITDALVVANSILNLGYIPTWEKKLVSYEKE